MVALVERVGYGAVAVHCTYLLPDGSDKADLPKNEQRSCFGPVGSGAVRFGMPHAGTIVARAISRPRAAGTCRPRDASPIGDL